MISVVIPCLLYTSCLIAMLMFALIIDKDYRSNVKHGSGSFPFTQYLTVETTDIPVYITQMCIRDRVGLVAIMTSSVSDSLAISSFILSC